MPTRTTPGLVDWSPIGRLPEVYAQGQQRAREDAFRTALGALTGGGNAFDYEKAVQLAAQYGNMGAMQALAGIQHHKAQLGQQAAQLGETSRHHKAVEDIQRRTLEEGKTPFGWTAAPGGGVAYKPGGPADPTYIQAASEAKAKPREFSVSDVTKLSEEGGKFADVSSFAKTFEDRFAGYTNPLAGSVAMTAGRYLPSGVVGKDISEGAAWWQRYDRFKNVVRNDLFGSALTANEQRAFEQADVSPGMNAEQIRKNLQRQQEVAMNGLRRKANALIQSGYDPKAIAAAYGLDLKDIGVTATSKRSNDRVPQQQQPPAPQQAPVSPNQIPQEAIQRLRTNPHEAEMFDQIFGPGAAARVLGVI